MRCGTVLSCILCGPCICVWLSLTACFCPSRLRRRNFSSEDKARFERRQLNAPRPSPVRKRALTVPLPQAPNQPRQQVLEQTDSLLFKLPLELRELIYLALLGDKTLHIVRKDRRLGHLRCKVNKADPYSRCPVQLGRLQTDARHSCWGSYNRDGIWANNKQPSDGDILPFLRTCRRAYSETISMLYSTNTFSFHDLDCIRYFSASILPKRFDIIRSLDVQWHFRWPSYNTLAQRLLATTMYPPHDEASWEDCWRIIASMKGLKKIQVSIRDSSNISDEEKEGCMLAPLYQVVHIPDFTVSLDWIGPTWSNSVFKVVRPTHGDEVDDTA